MVNDKCVIVTNGIFPIKRLLQGKKSSFFVGVDKGAIFLLNNNFPVHVAIGDFDSVFQKEFKLIKQKAKEVITFKREKDYTDTELALKTVIDKGYTDITILGAIGTRFDHTLANVLLLEKYQKNERQIKIIDENNEIEIVNGKKIITKNPNLPNISLISLTDSSLISLIGFKYPLKNKKVKRGETLCISNELVGKKGLIEVNKGKILLIRTKD